MAGIAANLKPMWKLLGEKIESEPPEPFHGSTYLGVVQRDVENNDDQIRSKQELMKTLFCLLYTSPSPRDRTRARMPSSA